MLVHALTGVDFHIMCDTNNRIPVNEGEDYGIRIVILHVGPGALLELYLISKWEDQFPLRKWLLWRVYSRVLYCSEDSSFPKLASLGSTAQIPNNYTIWSWKPYVVLFREGLFLKKYTKSGNNKKPRRYCHSKIKRWHLQAMVMFQPEIEKKENI